MNGDDPVHDLLRLLVDMAQWFCKNPWWLFLFFMFFGSSITGAIRAWLKHRRYIAKLKYENAQNATSSAELNGLQERCAALEKRCATLEQSGVDAAALNARCARLEEQVLAAHMQLADERRTLDNKLNGLLGDVPATERTPSKNAPVKTVL
jgi:hypothetical protein